MSWDFGGGGTGAAGESQRSEGWSTPGGNPATPQVQNPGFGFDPAVATSPTSPRGTGGASAPVAWLVLGLGLAIVAIAVHEVSSGFWSGVTGWLVGGPVVIGLLAVFVNQDTARRADPWYAESPFAPWARRALVVISLVAVVLNSLSIADFFSRGGF